MFNVKKQVTKALVGVMVKGQRAVMKRKEGQGFMEYAMIIGGVILVIVAVVTLFGDQIVAAFEDISGSIGVRSTPTVNPNGGGYN